MMVTECCIGTMMWGTANPEEAEAHAQLDKAILDLGANFLDTAELYSGLQISFECDSSNGFPGNNLAVRSLFSRFCQSS